LDECITTVSDAECTGREGTPDSDAVKALTSAQRNHMRVKAWTKVSFLSLVLMTDFGFLLNLHIQYQMHGMLSVCLY